MNRDSLRIVGVSLLLIAAGFLLAYQFVEPAPPKTITIASGSKSGAYYHFAKQYRDILKRNGIQLNILETQGSIENISLLKDRKADIAFVQGGTGNSSRDTELVSLGSLYFEPLWVFVRNERGIRRLDELSGMTISAGTEGSGTWAVARKLLADSSVPTDGDNILHLSSRDSARALLKGDIDAAFYVTSPASPLIREMLDAPGLRILNFKRAAAYIHRNTYLSAVSMPQGVISLTRDIPAQDTTLLAPTANLVTRQDLHPALQTLLTQLAAEIHGNGGFFEKPGQFPSAQYLDYPLSDDARRFLESGPSFLQRYVPFWAAVMLDRLKIMLVPLITLMIPLAKILPPTYRWRVRSRIYRWYESLKDIEQRALLATSREERLKLADEITSLEKEVKNLAVPLSYTDEVYNLRLHIDLVARNHSLTEDET